MEGRVEVQIFLMYARLLFVALLLLIKQSFDSPTI
jgi:hypothetical protein